MPDDPHNPTTDRKLLADVHVLVDDSTRVEVSVNVDRSVMGAGTSLAETVVAAIKAALNKTE